MFIMKKIIFHLLLTIRKPILVLSKILALLFLVGGGLLCIIVNGTHMIPWTPKIMILFFGIFFTLINWFYDDLIFYFTPDDMEVTLYR